MEASSGTIGPLAGRAAPASRSVLANKKRGPATIVARLIWAFMDARKMCLRRCCRQRKTKRASTCAHPETASIAGKFGDFNAVHPYLPAAFMATLKPFAALRPRPELAAQICELPYDVMSSDEARAVATGNPLSFLHVSKPEIDLPPGTDPTCRKFM